MQRKNKNLKLNLELLEQQSGLITQIISLQKCLATET